MEGAVDEPTGHDQAIRLLAKYAHAESIATVLEVGGSKGNNLLLHLERHSGELAERVEYRNLDIAPPKETSIPTIRGDITTRIDIQSDSVDFLFCARTLEHVTRPWKAAEEITRVVRPGGHLYVSVPFAWRYHPLPVDYWRFSPPCLEFLFSEFTTLECNFTSAFRRRDMRGFWKSRSDAVPIDDFGGFRENWESFFFGRKAGPLGISASGATP